MENWINMIEVYRYIHHQHTILVIKSMDLRMQAQSAIHNISPAFNRHIKGWKTLKQAAKIARERVLFRKETRIDHFQMANY
jgi:hypothetical protein